MSNNAPDYEDNLFFSPEKPLNLYEENQQLKELLKECRIYVENCEQFNQYDLDMLKKIDNAIGENK